MELQLGLALPTNQPNKGYFDLNNNSYAYDNFENTRPIKKTLSLLSWNNEDEDDDRKNPNNKSLTGSNYDDVDEGDEVVGWPPIETWRRRKLHHHALHGGDNPRAVNNGGGGPQGSMFVKVKMEGVGIGRKINLGLYHSYEMLTASLTDMFGKYQSQGNRGPYDNLDEGVTPYVLTYQDRERDWLLVGDVPWQTFILSVQGLKIQRRIGN